MREIKTTNCAQHHHPEVIISMRNDEAYFPAWLVEYVESAVKDGAQFRKGETFQIGWMITQFEETPDGCLDLWEPDFTSMPIQWIRGCDRTVRDLILQKSICHDLGCEPAFPALWDAGVVSPSFTKDRGALHMDRAEPNARDSGWLMRELTYGGHKAEYQSLYQISLTRPETVAFLAVPPGSTIEMTADRIDISFESREISSSSNDLLQQLLHE